jgi:hypothetical protein
MTLEEQETAVDRLGSPWSAMRQSFLQNLDWQINTLNKDFRVKAEWRGDIEQAHRDNYAHLVAKLLELGKR